MAVFPPAVRRLLKPVVFLACLWPALRLAAGAFGLAGVSLGADPVAMLLHTCGKWTLNFLMITLCMTPLRMATKSITWLRLRRMFGLFAFFYALMHFAVYLFLDQAGRWKALWEDVVKRPYITIGMLALLLLVPLAVTSTAGWQRRLGRQWIRLHRLVYVIALLGVWHYWWQVKKDVREPMLYACGLAILLGLRLWNRRGPKTLRVSAVRAARSDASSTAASR